MTNKYSKYLWPTSHTHKLRGKVRLMHILKNTFSLHLDATGLQHVCLQLVKKFHFSFSYYCQLWVFEHLDIWHKERTGCVVKEHTIFAYYCKYDL